MNFVESVARELDFYRIRESISKLCISEEGRDFLNTQEPLTDSNEIEKLKNLGREWHTYLGSSNTQALYAWPPVKDLFSVLGKDGIQLSQDQIYALGIFSRSVIHCKNTVSSASENISIPDLAHETSEIPDCSPAANKIFSILTNEGEVRDLPVLREIRERIARLHKEIENAVRKYTGNPQYSNALQSTVPAYRAERELLAVRADHRGEINGIVHEVSASGQTLYIEPQEIVRANNELLEEEFHLQAELRKIFQELTAQLGEHKEDLILAHQKMLLLDRTYAAARWQNEMHGVFAELCENEDIPPAIIQARHPLLGEKAVPVDIKFMEGKRILIITGPNTGGKTVTLKTIALFALLNQTGFPVPAAEGTRLPVFSSVFADIGDEQSIDDSLSTFSAHMKRIAEMIENADKDSLLLLDELGSGTDPQEGGALAMAALDTFIERGSFVITTTHHGILKNYGYTNAHCINASVEFDGTTLSPTYRLLMGVPGESHALDIALRSGINNSIVEKAKSYITNQQADVSTLITGLTAKHSELDDLIRENKMHGSKLEQKELRLHEREVALRERELSLKEKEQQKDSVFVRETRSQLENLVRKLREGEINREKTLGVKNFLEDISEQLELNKDSLETENKNLEQEKKSLSEEKEKIASNGIRLSSLNARKSSSNKKTKQRLSNSEALKNAVPLEPSRQTQKKAQKNPLPVKTELAPGTEVFVGRERRRGTLVSLNRNGSWLVQIGALKMSIPAQQIMPVTPVQSIQDQSHIQTKADYELETVSSENEKPAFELRLLGMRYEDAIKALEKQLDLCAIHNFKNFSVIHGKGNGILQQAVHDYLSNYPGVKNFSFAQPEDGGFGKTYVELI